MAAYTTPFFIIFIFIFFLPLITCSNPCNSSSPYPFCNTSLPINVRAQSLIALLTLPEKTLLLSNNASALPRLAIASYQWWSEALHGVAPNGPGVSFSSPVPAATTFPQVLLTSAAFNRTLWRSIGSAIGVEARAMHNVGQAGLTFWAPNVNLFRDPRWGRGQETPGEDPMAASAYAVEFVRGFQNQNEGGGGRRALEEGDGMGVMMVSACCKHFAAYDLEKWGNFSRYSFDAVVSED